jgi:putative alpha-1,2-mannosidase
MYPAVPSTPILALGAPLFAHAQVNLPSGHAINIDAPGAADNATTVQGMTVDGITHDRTWLNWNDLRAGAEIRETLITSPSSTWGTAPGAAPPSFPEDEACAPIPSAMSGETTAAAIGHQRAAKQD